LHHDGSRRIKVNAKQMALDLRQSATWLRSMKERGAYFAKLQSARGQVELDNLTVTGAYDDPAGWNFTSTGTFKHLEIRHADFPDRIALAHGKFVAHQGRIRFSDTTAAMSDAALIAGGTFEYTKEGAFQSDISGTGTVGAQMTQRLSRYVELPEDLKLRSPLKISAGHFTWRAGGDISFRGRVTVARGPQISLDAVKQPWGLALRNLTIDDGDRHARMTLQLAKDNLDLSFSGELTQQMIDRLFVSFPMKGSSLRGDFQAHAVLASPITVSARGQLSGSNLLVPLGTEKALLEAFSLEANGESVLVRSAELRWGASRLAMSGKVTGAKDALRVDADVTADQLDGEELQRFFDSERKQRQQEHGQPIPPIEGVIRLKTDRFRFERFNFSPLEIKSDISPLGVRAEIKRGVVCGIDATGNFEVGSKDIGLDLQLSAADAQLEPTTICLTNRQSEVKGTYSLTARIGGRGDREHWRSSLKGDFQLSARDGEFVRSAGIDATFDYLNKTGDFNVKFPDLNKQAFPYSVLTAKGKIDGETLLSDEIVIQATPLTVTGEGSFDLQRKQVDVKGLVSVGLPANQVIKSIPIIGAVIGGSLVGIPIRISGSMERPEVSYLSPADIGGELLSLPMKILGAPLDAIRLFVPSGEKTDKNSTR